MLVVTGSGEVPEGAKGAVLAIGNFDGVHRGHQALLAKVRERAAQLGAPAGVIIFEPHPREFFQPDEPHFHLTPLPLKLQRFERLGLDVVIVMPFDAAFASQSAARFIEGALVRRLQPRHIVIGYDFFFGKGRSGTPETMRLAGQEFGFGVSVISPVAEDGEVFSSTGVRLKLAQGDVRGATKDLGEPWRIRGRVIGGAKRGTGLGFPTANVRLESGAALAHGIYAVWVEIRGAGASDDSPAGARFMGAAYLGTRPTFDNGAPVLEIFLLDFDGDLYGAEVEVAFIDHIREDQRFADAASLVAQMHTDCEAVRQVLSVEAGGVANAR